MMSERVYNCLPHLRLLKKRIHECSEKLKTSSMVFLQFVRYGLHLEATVVLKGPLFWRGKFNFE